VAEKMKAIVKVRPEPGAEYREMDVPRIAPDQVLVKVTATSICGTDVHIYKWDHWSRGRIGAQGLPRIMGHEFAGEVVEIGSHVKRVAVGDYISAETHIPHPGDLQYLLCQMNIGERMKIISLDIDGCFAHYVAVPEIVCWLNDKSVPPEVASVQEPLGNAVYAVLGEDSDVAGKTMALIGDGPVALFATGVARTCGVTRIFLIGMSEFAMEIARKMGADHTLDVTKTTLEERARFIRDHTGGYGVDVAVDMAGNQEAVTECFRHLRKGGRMSAFGLAPDNVLSIDYNNDIVFHGIKIYGISGRRLFDTWYRVRNFLSSGRLDISPVITHMFALEDFELGFKEMTAQPRACAKVILFPDREELEAARKRRGIR
jgi:threonine 3-dehydrogenase